MRVAQALAVLTVLSLAALAVSNPTPLHDVSSTTISVSKDHPTAAHPTDDSISVTVQRVDELMGDAGDLIAARIVDVVFHFDMKDDQITLNGVPVQLGISSVEIDSVIIAGGDMTAIPIDVLDSAMGHGLAKVEVGAEAQALMLARADLVQDPSTHPELANSTLPDIIEVRRVTVNARVVEVDGHKVVQTDLVEQIMDVYMGKVLRGKPTRIPVEKGMAGMKASAAAMHNMDPVKMMNGGHHGECLHHRRLASMWRRLPHATRIAVAAFLGSLVLLVFFVAIPITIYVHWKERKAGYHRLPTNGVLVNVDGPLLEDKEDEEEEDDVDMQDVNHHTKGDTKL